MGQNRTGPQDLERFGEYLDVAVSEAERCGRIVGNLLSFARQQSLEPRRVNLVDLFHQIIMVTGHRMELADIKVVTDFQAEQLSVWGDYNQLQQSLTNLIFNAIEAMPQGGRLTVRGGVDELSPRIWVEVSDTGQGISPENLPYIFDPFFTTKGEGMGVGLGLSMVYGIIRDHRGTISVDSTPGRGTTFRVVLPAMEADAAREAL